MTTSRVRICFVCLGNICRSPTAEGVMVKLVADARLTDRFLIDSAGTGAYHAGEYADPRSREEARARGIQLTSVARQFVATDFARFDYVIAMDRGNQRALRGLANGEGELAKIHLLRSFDPTADALDVPDPYHGGAQGFAHVFDICQAGCRALLAQLRAEHGL